MAIQMVATSRGVKVLNLKMRLKKKERRREQLFFSRGEILLFYVAALNGLPAGSCNSNNNMMASEVLSLGS